MAPRRAGCLSSPSRPLAASPPGRRRGGTAARAWGAGGVRPVAALDAVLQDVVLARQHLRQQLLEQGLAEPAADLRRLEHLLEAVDLPPHLHNPLGGLAELAEAALHLADHLGRAVEPLAHGALRILDEPPALLELTGDLRRDALELPRHGDPQRGDLIAHPRAEV